MTYPRDPTTPDEALQTLAAFARTAPGMLPSRVSEALRIAAEAAEPRFTEAQLMNIVERAIAASLAEVARQGGPEYLMKEARSDGLSARSRANALLEREPETIDTRVSADLAATRAALVEAREECAREARECEAYGREEQAKASARSANNWTHEDGKAFGAYDCAARIRALALSGDRSPGS